MNSCGKLYIVATPIGNLQDITLRAIETLKQVDVVLCEDTRHSKALLQHFSINKPLQALHEHNEISVAKRVLSDIAVGKNFALISDAGTPLLSDPGFVLVRELQANAMTVVPIPGACAAIVALSAAGLPTDQFSFYGFLPAKPQARSKRLQGLAKEPLTMIFYESTHRITACLADMAEIFGAGRKLVLAKELTKQHENLITGTANEIIAWLQADSARSKGEFVILVPGFEKQADLKFEINLQDLLAELAANMPTKQAASVAAKLSGEKKNRLYKMLCQLA